MKLFLKLEFSLLLQIAGQIGCLTKVYINNRVQVYVQGRGWLLDPLCLEPAPGETASYTSDPNSMTLIAEWEVRQLIVLLGVRICASVYIYV